MTSLFLYGCLAAIGAGTGAFTIYKKRNTFKVSTLVVFYLFAICITWIGEFTALGIFNGYVYKPGAFPDPWAENIVGQLLLNTTIWPGAATLAAAYSLGYGWKSVIVAFFIFAEYLFARLGIYEQHWWNYYMSAVIVVIFLYVSKRWFKKITEIRYGLPRVIILFFAMFVIIHIPAPLLLLFGKEYYNSGLIENMVGNIYRSSTIFIFFYNLIETFLLVYFVCILDKWFWKLVPFIISFIGQSILAEMNILVFLNGWKLSYTLLIYGVCLSVCILMEKYTLKPVRQYF